MILVKVVLPRLPLPEPFADNPFSLADELMVLSNLSFISVKDLIRVLSGIFLRNSILINLSILSSCKVVLTKEITRCILCGSSKTSSVR